MSMTPTALRDYVRASLDTDEEELPDTLLNVFYEQAVNRFANAAQHWEHYEKAYTASSTADDQTLTFAEIGADLRDPIEIVGPSWRLEPIPHDVAFELFPQGTERGTPTHWSVWADTVYLWPTPTTGESLRVRGYRTVTVDGTTDGAPDLPAELHPLVGEYMLARAYEFQDDDVMSQIKFGRMEQEFALLRRRYDNPMRGGPSYLGGGILRRGQYVLPERQRYDFE